MSFPSTRAVRQSLSNLFVLLVVMAFCLAAQAQVPLTQISSDPFTNPISDHATEVEAATFFNGNTIVTAFQQGRYTGNGGASDNGFATSTDGGAIFSGAHATIKESATTCGSRQPHHRVSCGASSL